MIQQNTPQTECRTDAMEITGVTQMADVEARGVLGGCIPSDDQTLEELMRSIIDTTVGGPWL